MNKKDLKGSLSNIGSTFRNHKGFFTALMALFAVLLVVFAYSARTIHPLTDSVPHYHRIWVWFVCLSVLTAVFIGFLAVNLFLKPVIKKAGINAVILSAAAFFGIVYMFVLPPMSAPDEIRHYLTAYKLSNQVMFKEAATEDGHVYMRAEDAKLLLNDYPGHDDYYRFLNNWRGEPDTTVVVFEDEVAQPNLWVAYVPQALGITLARLLNLRQIPLMMMGRLFNLAFFLVMLGFALHFMPFGKELSGLAALLPMTMELVSSLSYDAFILGISFLYIAYVLYMAFSCERIRIRDMAVVTAIMAVLGPIKIVYILLAFLMFIIPPEKFGSRKRYAISAVSMVAVIGSVFLILQLGKMNEFVEETNTYLNYAESESYTISWVLSHPVDSIKIMLNTFNVFAGEWFLQMIGGNLGWLEIAVQRVIPYLFAMLMVFAVAKPENEQSCLRGNQRIFMFGVVVLTILLTVFGMFIAYTPVDNPYVLGVQGRYFLPVLPLALVMMRSEKLKRSENSSGAVIYAACLLNFWAVVSVIEYICTRTGVMHMTTNT